MPKNKMTTKQVIVMRKDLNMRKGKMIAQGAHASMKRLAHKLLISNNSGQPVYLSEEEKNWFQGAFTKVCLYVSSEKELLDIFDKAKEAKLTVEMIVDSGVTEFHGTPTKTCLAIGPNKTEDIDKITGHLKLL